MTLQVFNMATEDAEAPTTFAIAIYMPDEVKLDWSAGDVA